MSCRMPEPCSPDSVCPVLSKKKNHFGGSVLAADLLPCTLPIQAFATASISLESTRKAEYRQRRRQRPTEGGNRAADRPFWPLVYEAQNGRGLSSIRPQHWKNCIVSEGRQWHPRIVQHRTWACDSLCLRSGQMLRAEKFNSPPGSTLSLLAGLGRASG